MNRYPFWKYGLMLLVFLGALLFAAPNFFGESPAVQVSNSNPEQKVTEELLDRILKLLKDAALVPLSVEQQDGSVKVRFPDIGTQLKAKETIEHFFNSEEFSVSGTGWLVALNLLSNSPSWLRWIKVLPMYLGLDLRGGVHFLLKVDFDQAFTKKLKTIASELRNQMRNSKIRYSQIAVHTPYIALTVPIQVDSKLIKKLLLEIEPDFIEVDQRGSLNGVEPTKRNKMLFRLNPKAVSRLEQSVVLQNTLILRNRINELGVAEPLIQQQGSDRIIVQLPGVQDTAKAKDILGRTAALEMRLLCESPEELSQLGAGQVPAYCEKYSQRGGNPILLQKEVLLTGESLVDAQAGFDSESRQPAVHLRLDPRGSRIFQDVTRANINKRIAILLTEKNKGEVITAPVIRGEIPAGRVQISGSMSVQEASDTALILRSGALAAPMAIVEERTIGPSLGADNIHKGFRSTFWGCVAIAFFMCLYYQLFGLISAICLSVNLLLLIGLLSLIQATLTLPGIAAIALTLGMAIDANVLINERIREELRKGASPKSSIAMGYSRAWSTIIDSNITSLIVGISLLVFGSGPIRGFAVVHCLGILTSLFSSVFFSRGLVNIVYGRRRVLEKLAIG